MDIGEYRRWIINWHVNLNLLKGGCYFYKRGVIEIISEKCIEINIKLIIYDIIKI